MSRARLWGYQILCWALAVAGIALLLSIIWWGGQRKPRAVKGATRKPALNQLIPSKGIPPLCWTQQSRQGC
jgi:hypothetical protein